MMPRITVLTLAVADLAHAVAFYRDGLGLPTEGIVRTGFEHDRSGSSSLPGGVEADELARQYEELAATRIAVRL